MKPDKVDPNNLTRSHLNERTNQIVAEGCDLVEDIKQVGMNHYPIVHEITEEHIEENPDVYGDLDDDVLYAVAVGWRRVLAMRILGKDVFVKVRADDDGLSDGDLLAKSISDNKENLSQDTDLFQRARSVKRLKDMEGLSNSELGERLSVGKSTISKWLEPYQWNEATPLNPDGSFGAETLDPSEFSLESISITRRSVGGGELGIKALEYVQEHELPSSAVREAKADNEYDFFIGLWSEANERSDEHVEKHPVLNDLEPPEPEPEEQESDEPEQDESDEPEQELDEPEESDETGEDERIEAVLSDLYDVESQGDREFIDGILGYIDSYDLSAADVEDAREDRNPDSEESFMNQLHIRAGNENRIHSGPEYDEIHGSDEPEEEEAEETDEPEWSDSVSSSDEESDESDFAGTEPGEFKEENSTPEDLAPEAETDGSDESEESQGESNTENAPVAQTQNSDDERPDSMPYDDNYDIGDEIDGYDTTVEWPKEFVETVGEEKAVEVFDHIRDTQEILEEWENDEFVSQTQTHSSSFFWMSMFFRHPPSTVGCPECGESTTELEWSCCGVPFVESMQKHAEKHVERGDETLERMSEIADEIRNGEYVESEVKE